MKKNYSIKGVRIYLQEKFARLSYTIAATLCLTLNVNSQSAAALNFDGLNDQVIVPHNASLNLVNLYTFEAWVNPSGSAFKTILSKGDLNGGPLTGEYCFQITGSGQLALYATGNNGWIYSTPGAVTNGVWSHVAVTNDGTNVRFYVNGSLISSSSVVTSLLSPGTNPMYIGRQGTTCNCNFMNGGMDEVRVWNVARTQCEILSFMNCEIPTSATGLLANYHFNQGVASGANSAVTTLNDASGNLFNGTLANLALTGATSNWIAPGGVISGFTNSTNCVNGGEALDFDGTNDFVNMGNLGATQFPNTLPYTIETWIKPKSGFGAGTIAGMFNGGVTASWGLFLNANGSITSYRNVGPFSLVTAAGLILPNVWSHVATVYNGSTLFIYVNGQLATSGSFLSTQPPTSAPLLIGANLNSGTPNNFFNGQMDEFRIWNVARTQCQINTFMNAEIPTSATNLIANYHFNTGTPLANNGGITSLFESTGNNFNGTLNNFSLTGSISNWVSPGSVTSGFTTALAPPVISVNNGTICSGNTFTISPSGASNYTIQGGSTFVSPLISSSYTVIGTSTTGCLSSNTATSNLTVNTTPTVTVNNGTICSGNSFTILPGGALTYTIQGGTNVVSPLSTSNYTVKGSSAAGCVSANTATSNITVNTTPTVNVNSGAICAGNSITLTPSGASTYTFSGGSAVVSPTATSAYTVTGTNTVGCNGSAVSNVTVNALPSVIAVSSNTAFICVGSSATLTASGASSYVWNTTATTSVIAVSPTTTTSYTVTGTGANGCSANAVLTQSVNTCTGIDNLSLNISNLSFQVYPNPSNGIFNIQIENAATIEITDVLGRVILTDKVNAGNYQLNLGNNVNGVYFVKATVDGKTKTVKIVKE